MNKNIHFAVMSGFCASAASIFGKLSGLPTFQDYLLLRAVFFICMILCNGGVWTLFVKALQHTDSSLTPTVTSSASNYVLSALAGVFLFGEVISLLWWSGMFLIIVGLLLVLQDGATMMTLKKIKQSNK